MKKILLACDRCGKLLLCEKENLCSFYCNGSLKLELLLCPSCRENFFGPLLQGLLRQKEDIDYDFQRRIKEGLKPSLQEPEEGQT